LNSPEGKAEIEERKRQAETEERKRQQEREREIKSASCAECNHLGLIFPGTHFYSCKKRFGSVSLWHPACDKFEARMARENGELQ